LDPAPVDVCLSLLSCAGLVGLGTGTYVYVYVVPRARTYCTGACCRLQLGLGGTTLVRLHLHACYWDAKTCAATILSFFLARDREHFCSGNFVHCVSRDRFGTNVEIETGCSVPCVFCRFPHVTPCELSRVVVTSGHSTFGNRGPKLGKVKHNFSGNRSGPWLHNETPQLWENWSLHTYLPQTL
jgi:hypothetical protein